MPLPKVLPKFSNVFVETGTYFGLGVEKALKSGYKKIISIELHKDHYQMNKIKYKDYNNVEIFFGDSALILEECIENIEEEITFWLDGHSCGKNTNSAIGKKEFPILEELQQIKKHKNKNHTILIDDIRCWKNYDKELNLDSVFSYIKEINEEYIIDFMDGEYIGTKKDILLATPPFVYNLFSYKVI